MSFNNLARWFTLNHIKAIRNSGIWSKYIFEVQKELTLHLYPLKAVQILKLLFCHYQNVDPKTKIGVELAN